MKDVKRLTYRLSNKTFQAISKSAEERNITVNAEINRVLYAYYFERKPNQNQVK